MDHQLLPVGTEAPRCSDFARSIDASPVGSGLSLNRVILVSVPLPWPKPALGHPALKPGAAAVAHSPVSSRLFAAEPWPGAAGHTVAAGLLEVYDRIGTETLVAQIPASSAAGSADVATVLQSISAAELGEIEGSRPLDQPTFLVCTQGTHDGCCGTYGVDLAATIEAERPEFGLRRVSHTGGHRFAPTFLALPQGRMWAHADLALVDRIAAGTVSADDLSTRCRGALSAAVGPAQVAENAVRAAHGVPFGYEPIVQVSELEPGSFDCTVSAGPQQWQVKVAVARSIPTIACESPGGLPSKLGREFSWSRPTQVTP